MDLEKTEFTISVLALGMRKSVLRQLPRPSIYPEDTDKFVPLCWIDYTAIEKDTWQTRAIVGVFDGVPVVYPLSNGSSVAKLGKTTILWKPTGAEIPFAIVK